jgi:hypothetical protein
VKNRGDDPIQVIIHIYTWKCHKEIPCIGISNKQKNFFFLQNQRTGKLNNFCPGNFYQWEWGRCRKRVWEGEYGVLSVYTCM